MHFRLNKLIHKKRKNEHLTCHTIIRFADWIGTFVLGCNKSPQRKFVSYNYTFFVLRPDNWINWI